MRFPTDVFNGTHKAELSADEYVKNLGILSTKVWQSARAAQKIAQLDSSKYYNKKHGIKKDIKTGDLVFKTEIPRNKSDTTTHLLPRCSGPFKVVQISTKGAVLKIWSQARQTQFHCGTYAKSMFVMVMRRLVQRLESKDQNIRKGISLLLKCTRDVIRSRNGTW